MASTTAVEITGKKRVKISLNLVWIGKFGMVDYIKIAPGDNRYLSLQQPLLGLAWLLYFKKDPLRPATRPDSRTRSISYGIWWLRICLWNFRKKMQILIKFMSYKYHLQTIDPAVTLPFYGQMCIPVYQGFKVFDLHKGVVFKVFDKAVETFMIASEVEKLKHISKIPFAPSIRKWNIEEKWYEEEYVDGAYENSNKPLDSKHVLHKFRQQLVPHIRTLVLFHKSQTKNARVYIDEIMPTLDLNSWRSQSFSAKESDNVKSFMKAIVEKIHNKGNHIVHLVFTHGDFCPANMLKAKEGIIIVDWEGAKYRSALFDVYSYFFHRSACRNVPIESVVYETREVLSAIISELKNEANGISQSLVNSEKVYRWIFYLEYVCRIIERVVTDKELDTSRYLIGYIEAFKKYEETVANE